MWAATRQRCQGVVLPPGRMLFRTQRRTHSTVRHARQHGEVRIVGDGANHWSTIHLDDLQGATLSARRHQPGRWRTLHGLRRHAPTPGEDCPRRGQSLRRRCCPAQIPLAEHQQISCWPTAWRWIAARPAPRRRATSVGPSQTFRVRRDPRRIVPLSTDERCSLRFDQAVRPPVNRRQLARLQ